MRIDHPHDIYHHIQHHNIVPIGLRRVEAFTRWENTKTTHETRDELFTLTPEDLNYHSVVVGKTGSGKTTWLKNAIISRIHHGEGVAVIDPHGDLTDELLDYIPGQRLPHLILIDLDDLSYGSVGINVVSQVPLDQQAFHIRDILDALKHYFGHSWGPRMEWYLTNALLAHVSIHNATLLGVKLMLENNAYRQWVAKNCTNPQAQDFWRYEFPNQRPAFQQEAVAPIQNKLGPLLAMPHTQNMFGQVGSTVDFRWAMDHNRIIFIRLAKGVIGEDNANLLGSLCISLLVKAGLSRADQEPEDRVPFSMFIDEAHSFTTASLKTAYSELRKYGWNLISASQRFGKFEDNIRDDILSNAGTAIAFNVGPDDADLLAHHFPRDDDGKPWEPYMFRELANYTCAVADRFGGSHVYRTLPALTGPFHHGLRHQALQETRERYQRPRAIIEKKISRWRDYWRQAEGGLYSMRAKNYRHDRKGVQKSSMT